MLRSRPVIAFVPTTDFDKARAFYRDTLRLELIGEDGFALVFDANGIMLRVVRVRDHTPAKYTILGWEAAEFDAEFENLTNSGVVFERYGMPNQDERGIWTAPDGTKVAWFKDPDGNTLSISQHEQRSNTRPHRP